MIVDDKGIEDPWSWKEYMEKLVNEENEWYHKLTAEVKEGPADWKDNVESKGMRVNMNKTNVMISGEIRW